VYVSGFVYVSLSVCVCVCQYVEKQRRVSSAKY